MNDRNDWIGTLDKEQSRRISALERKVEALQSLVWRMWGGIAVLGFLLTLFAAKFIGLFGK